MTKKEFLEGLKNELSFLPEEELREALRYYDEYITEAGNDAERVIETLGNPQKAAEDFRKEYYDRGVFSQEVPAVIGENDSSEKKWNMPAWFYIVIAAGIIAVALPVVCNVIPWLVGVAVILLVAFIIIKTVGDKKNETVIINNEGIKTASDVKDISILLRAGNFHIKKGDRFFVDTSQASGIKMRSFVRGGVWNVESETVKLGCNIGKVTITVPYGFCADNAKVCVNMGNIVMDELSADKVSLSVDVGKCEFMNMYSRGMSVRCGMGEVKGDCAVDGDVDINCGMGSVRLNIKNKREEFNYQTSVGLGSVDIDGEKISGAAGGASVNTGAPNNLNIRCGMGNVKVLFGN